MPDEDSREFLLRDNCRKDGMIESEEMFFFSFFQSNFGPLFSFRLENTFRSETGSRVFLCMFYYYYYSRNFLEINLIIIYFYSI